MGHVNMGLHMTFCMLSKYMVICQRPFSKVSLVGLMTSINKDIWFLGEVVICSEVQCHLVSLFFSKYCDLSTVLVLYFISFKIEKGS
jgi:hypothetical protein